jgi:uncharacterized membrane protein
MLISLALISTAGFLWLAYRLSLRWWPSLLIRMVILALLIAVVGVGSQSDRKEGAGHQILLVDVSDSISGDSSKVAQVFANQWRLAGEGREVIVFGNQADVLLSEDWPEVDPAGSDLTEALRLAETRLAGTPGSVLIASDGLIADDKVVAAAIDRLTADQVTVQFLGLDASDYPGDAYIASVRGADRVWPGAAFQIQVEIYSRSAREATLEITSGGQVIESSLTLGVGWNQETISLKAGDPGVLPLGFRILVKDDPFLGNNSYYKSVEVLPEQDVLFVTSAERNARKLINSLKTEGLNVQVIPPADFPREVQALRPYPVVMIHDILAQDLDLEQMRALELHIVQFGKSAIFLGGNNSFSLGGYQNTPLEPLLPVILTPPTRVQRVPLTFLMVLDRSGSMAGDRDTDIAPIALTREAAMRAIETLRPDDYIGVLTFASTLKWDVPLAPVGDGLVLRSAQDKVSQIQAVGGTNMYLGLEEAVAELSGAITTDYLHILLMSDGVSGDGSMDEFNALVQQARRNGITISTIALGRESDPETLSAIAEVGEGRFYYVLEPVDLSTVMLDESRAVQTENVQEGRTSVLLGIEDHPVISSVTLDAESLSVDGYLAVQSKSALSAEDVLLTGNFQDPLLSIWQVGLGHTAAWMGDVGESWLPNFENWDDLGKFWYQVIQYTLPDPKIGEPDVDVTIGASQVIVDLQLPQAVRLALEPGSLHFLLPVNDGQVFDLPISQVSVSHYQAEFSKPPDGAYSGVIQYTAGGVEEQILVPFEINYPEEWQFEPPTVGTDRIDEWTANTGADQIPMESGLPAESTSQKSGRGYEILLGLLLVFWPMEIAIRRWWMPWRRP